METESLLRKPFAVFNDIVTACETEGIKLSQQKAAIGNMEPLYLYYKKSTETDNGLLLLVGDSDSVPDGFELATGEGLRCNVPYSSYWAWIKQRSTRLPVLAYGV